MSYPGSVSTTTRSPRAPVAIYGVSTTATARVSRDEAGAEDAGWELRFILKNNDGSVRKSVDRGRSPAARPPITLPRRLPSKRTYTVRARYIPPSCTIFKPSSSQRGRTTPSARPAPAPAVNAPNVHRGERAHVHVKVRSGSPLDPHGRVRIVVERNGKAIASQVHRLRSGRANATFRRFHPGHYNVKVRYLGARNFRASHGEDDFRVYRH